MIIKMYYNRNLKMTDGKLAAQCGHVGRELGRMVPADGKNETIIVLGLSATKFNEMLDLLKDYEYHYVQVDSGRTEVEPGTATVCGYVQPWERSSDKD